MKKLIMVFSCLLLSCSNSTSSPAEEMVLSLVKKQDNATLLSMMEEGALHSNYQTSAGKTLLHLAIVHDNLALLQDLVEQGVPLDTTDGNGNTPLMFSIIQGKELFAETLIDYQADTNYQNKNGDTALILAAKKGMESTVMALIEKTDGQTDPNLKNLQNKKALDYLVPNTLAYTSLSRYLERFNASSSF